MEKMMIRIVSGELESKSSTWSLLYSNLVKTIWKEGASGVTVLRSNQGIDENNDYRMFVLEDVQFNNLPITIDSVVEKDKLDQILSPLQKMMPHGLIYVKKVYTILEGAFPMDIGDHMALRIYLKEESHWFSQQLYQEILGSIQDEQLIWSTVHRGIEGFGHDHVIHKQKMFSFSSQVPIVIETVGKTETIQSLVPMLKERIQDGLVIAYPVDVIMNH